MSNVVGEAVVRLGVDMLGLNAGLAQGSSQLQSFGQNLSFAGQQISTLGKQTAIAGGAILAGLGFGVKAGIDFEQGMANVKKTTGLTNDEMNMLSSGIRDLARSMAVGHSGLAEIATVAGQLGINGIDNILAFTETVARAQVTLNMTAEDAATAMAVISNSFRTPITESENFASALNALENTTSATAQEILQSMVNMSGSAAQLGITRQEAAALGTTLISMGTDGFRAGTELNTAFTAVARNADLMAEQMGVSSESMRKKINENPIEAIMDYLRWLEQVPDTTERMTLATDVFTITGAKAFLRMTGNTDLFYKSLKTANEEFDKGTSLQQEYAVFSDTTGNKLKILMNRFVDLGIRIAEVLAPAIEKIMDVVDKVLDSLESMDPQIQKMMVSGVAAFGALLVALGPFLMIVGQIATSVGGLVAGIAGAGGLAAAGEIILPVFGAIAGIAGLVAGAIVGITTAIAGGKAMWESNFGGFRDTLNEIAGVLRETLIPIWDNLKETVSNSIEKIRQWFEDNRPWIEDLVDAIMTAVKNITENVMPLLKDMYEWIRDKLVSGLDKFLQWWTDNGPIIEGAVRNIGKAIEWLVEYVGPYFNLMMKSIGDAMTGILGNALKFVGDLLMLLAALIGGDWDKALQKLKDMGMDLLGIVKSLPVVKPMLEMFDALTKMDAWSKIGGWFENLWNNIKNWFTNLGKSIATWLYDSYVKPWVDAFENVKKKVQDAMNNFTGVFGDAGISDVFSSLGEKIISPFVTAWEKLTEWFNNTVQGVKDFFTRIAEAVLGNPVVQEIMWWVQTIYDIVSSVWFIMLEFVKTKFTEFGAWISEKVAIITEWWSEKWGLVRDFFVDVWNAIVEWVTPKIQFIQDIIDTSINYIKTLWETVWGAIKEFFIEIWNNIYDWVSEKINAVNEIITTVVNAISAWWGPIWDGIKKKVIDIFTSIYDFVHEKMEAIRGWIDTKLNAIKSKWEEIWNAINNWFRNTLLSPLVTFVRDKLEDIRSWFVSKLGAAKTWVENTWTKIKDAIVNPIREAYEEAKKWVDNIREKLKALDPRHRESPSIVDNVKAGFAELSKLMNDFPNQVDVGLRYSLSALSNSTGLSLQSASMGGRLEVHSHLYLDSKEIYEHVKSIEMQEESREF